MSKKNKITIDDLIEKDAMKVYKEYYKLLKKIVKLQDKSSNSNARESLRKYLSNKPIEYSELDMSSFTNFHLLNKEFFDKQQVCVPVVLAERLEHYYNNFTYIHNFSEKERVEALRYFNSLLR